MTEKELKKLNRRELLEMLIVKTAQNEQLSDENEKLKAQLEDKRISIAKCGTMAEAAIGLTKLFEEADKAVTIYVENYGLSRKDMPEAEIPTYTAPDVDVPEETPPEAEPPADEAPEVTETVVETVADSPMEELPPTLFKYDAVAELDLGLPSSFNYDDTVEISDAELEKLIKELHLDNEE